MKKKTSILVVSMVLLALFAGQSMVFAADTVELPDWFSKMIEFKNERVDDAVEKGTITAEQAATIKEKIAEKECSFFQLS